MIPARVLSTLGENPGETSNRVYHTWLLWGSSHILILVFSTAELHMKIEVSHHAYSTCMDNTWVTHRSNGTVSAWSSVKAANLKLHHLFHSGFLFTVRYSWLILFAEGINLCSMRKVVCSSVFISAWLCSVQHWPSVVQDFSFLDMNTRLLVSQTSRLLISWKEWNNKLEKQQNNKHTECNEEKTNQAMIWMFYKVKESPSKKDFLRYAYEQTKNK